MLSNLKCSVISIVDTLYRSRSTMSNEDLIVLEFLDDSGLDGCKCLTVLLSDLSDKKNQIDIRYSEV